MGMSRNPSQMSRFLLATIHESQSPAGKGLLGEESLPQSYAVSLAVWENAVCGTFRDYS